MQPNSVFRRQSETVTGAKTLDAGDAGVVQVVTATATVSLPTIAAANTNATYTVVVGADSITVTINPVAADKFSGNGFTAAVDKDVISTNGRIGDEITFTSNGVTGGTWQITSVQGTWTRQA